MKTNRKKTIILTGATGFIGRILSEFLSTKGYEVLGLSRNPEKLKKKESPIQIHFWNPLKLDGWEKVLKKADIIINLAGENISAIRWTSKKKKRILNSRIQSTKILVQALLENDIRPEIFVQVSGIHFYGSRGDKIIDESVAAGDGFLAEVSQAVEASTDDIEGRGIRRILLRMGLVLGSKGGALPKLLLPFKLFVGGRMGSARQWISWIHHYDVCLAIEFLISQPNLTGPVNLTSPRPVQNREMAKTVGKILKRPAFFIIPGWMIKIFLGEMGEELLLSNQRVFPKYLTECGFKFKFPGFEASLNDLFK